MMCWRLRGVKNLQLAQIEMVNCAEMWLWLLYWWLLHQIMTSIICWHQTFEMKLSFFFFLPNCKSEIALAQTFLMCCRPESAESESGPKPSRASIKRSDNSSVLMSLIRPGWTEGFCHEKWEQFSKVNKCQVCRIIPKKTWSCHCCHNCFNQLNVSEYLYKKHILVLFLALWTYMFSNNRKENELSQIQEESETQ